MSVRMLVVLACWIIIGLLDVLCLAMAWGFVTSTTPLTAWVLMIFVVGPAAGWVLFASWHAGTSLLKWAQPRKV